MIRRAGLLVATGLTLTVAPGTPAQRDVAADPVGHQQRTTARAPRPFVVGERATYEIHYLFASGSGTMEVGAIDTVRGRKAFRFSFILDAGVPWFHIRDTLQSWVDTASFQSLRFYQDIHEGSADRKRRYEVFPDRLTFSAFGRPEEPSVADPLDDVSFLYFVRGLNLQVGAQHEFARYFRPESNPVKLSVVKRETIKVPFGEFKTVLVRPVIKAGGLFGEKGKAQVWFTDDSARMIVQVKIEMPVIGTLTLALKSYQPSLATPPRKP